MIAVDIMGLLIQLYKHSFSPQMHTKHLLYSDTVLGPELNSDQVRFLGLVPALVELSV